jgi:uncharacterized delta-60 repeat protein
VLLLSAAVVHPALAAPGDLDTSFGGDGKVTTDFTSRADAAFDVALQVDERIVAAGGSAFDGTNPKFAVARYNTDGTLDTSFGGDGKVTTDLTSRADAVFGVAIQADQKIVAAGDAGIGGANSKFGVVRYNVDGTLDTSFGGDGKVTTDFTSRLDSVAGLAIQTDGKILVSGGSGVDGSNPKFALARYNTDGTLDTSFGGDGKVTTDFTSRLDFANSVAVQDDAKIVAAGLARPSGSRAKFALARYNIDGTLDTSFGGDGKVTTGFTSAADSAQKVVIQGDSKLVAAGIAGSLGSNPKFAVARYNTDGTLDTAFGGDGKVTTDFTSRFDGAFGAGLQADGKIVAAGESGLGGAGSNPKVALARYNIDGTLDTAFSGDGKVTTDFTSREDFSRGVAIQTDGNIVLAGGSGLGGTNAKFALARYLAS